MSTTLQQITNEFYEIVNQPVDDGTGTNSIYGLTFVQNLANQVQQEICRSWKFPFLKKKYSFKTGVNTTLSSAVATTDTTINVGDNTGYASSGAIFLEHDIINHTGTGTNTFTGCTNIDVAHSTSAKVEALYALPSDFGQRPTLYLPNVQDGPFTFVPEVNYDTSDEVNRFTLEIDDNGTEYIRINHTQATTSYIAVFRYYKVPATMTTSVDATIPDEFALRVIPRTMAGVAEIIKGDNVDNLGTTILQVAQQDINEMQRYYGSRVDAEQPTMITEFSSRNPRSL